MPVDSSPSFRELDDVFLQSQARIWIGEVLHTRFDEQLSICDLLSDGELLFEVSKTLWNMLLTKYMELKSYKARMYVPVDTRKSSGRYRPYSNVDSFLKVCKVMGLSGVDLFSPSDVVEKRNTRKVCVCIRSLSTKARSKQLNVPDFDIVTSTVAMSTDAVRCIRRSLELSSMSSDTYKHARLKPRQKTSFATHKQEDGSYVEECDEAISDFPDTSCLDCLYLESPDMVDKYALTQSIRHSDASIRELDKFAHTQRSVLLQYVNSGNQLDETLSNFCESGLIICDEFTSPASSVLRRVLDFDSDFDAKSEPDDLTALESPTYGKMLGLCNHSEQKVLELSSDCLSPRWDDVTNSMQEYVAGKVSCDMLMKTADPKLTHNVDAIFNGRVGVKFSKRFDCCDEDTSEAAGKDERNYNSLAKADTNDKNEKRAAKKSSYMVPLLKTVAKGTTLIGVLFLLHLRNRSYRITKSEKSSQIHWKSIGVGFSKRQEEKIYPVEKFKFED